jgi:hypothetical protein
MRRPRYEVGVEMCRLSSDMEYCYNPNLKTIRHSSASGYRAPSTASWKRQNTGWQVRLLTTSAAIDILVGPTKYILHALSEPKNKKPLACAM